MGVERVGTNTGHGHAWARPDGVKMRCGGPAMCRECGADAALVAQWRKGDPASTSAAAGPIDPAQHDLMNGLAKLLDETFNGPGGAAARTDGKGIGFFLTTFNMQETGRFNYISNSDKADVRAMLTDIVARIEARMSTPGTA